VKGTIRSSREIDTMFRTARRASGRSLVVLAKRTPEGRGPRGRVAFIAGRRLGSAVGRNRSKRVMRQAARELGAPWTGWDVVVMARRMTGAAKPAALTAELHRLLVEAGVEE